LDQFSAHGTDQAVGIAAELMIEIMWVPERATIFYQPLHRRVFGALKSKGCAKRSCLYGQNYRHLSNRETAAWLLLESWDELFDSVMTAACDFNEDESDSNCDDNFELRLDTGREDLNGEFDMQGEEEDNEEEAEEQ
jgi:hypothetical protein